jgi:hypothetical protein
MSQTSHFERERAKRLYAAIMSSLAGTSFQTEYKRLGDRPISRRWHEWAEEITQELVDGVAEMMKPEKQERIH